MMGTESGGAGSFYRGLKIAITGGTGSVGLELAKAVLDHHPKEVRLFSNDENGLFEARTLFRGAPSVRFHLGDVRDLRSVESALSGCDVVIHAAALKHVDFCEMNPYEAVSTNIVGTQNVIEIARRERVKRLVYVSTDKAVNPVSTMGATKLLSERLTVNAGNLARSGVFCCVRFGNILGSRGSVLVIFERQVREGKSITVTDPEMTRFIMLPSEAAGLILDAGALAKPAETYVLRMPSVKVGDLARASLEFFCRRLGRDPSSYSIEEIGSNPEEKKHEELMTESEQRRSVRRGKFFVIPFPGREGRGSKGEGEGKPYSSNRADVLSREKLLEIMETLYADRLPSTR